MKQGLCHFNQNVSWLFQPWCKAYLCLVRRKKNKPQIIEHLLIESMAGEGRGIGRDQGKVVFVDYAMPGDRVTVKTKVSKKDYAIADIVQLEEGSQQRVPVFCSHFGLCGGCKWQHIPYDLQLVYKEQQVKEAFDRIGHLQYPGIQPIMGAPEDRFYRNKLEFTFSAKGWLTDEQIAGGETFDRRVAGFHIPGRFDSVLQVEKCWLQEDFSNQVRNFIRQWALEHDCSFYHVGENKGLLRNLILRNTSEGEWMVIISFGEDQRPLIQALLEAVAAQFLQIRSLQYVINTKHNDTLYDQEILCYKGAPFITERLGNKQYRIGPKSFFQTNSRQAKNLYDVVKRMADLKAPEVVYDLYTGTGTIALYVADQCAKVVGIETVPEAIEDAKVNAALNNSTNTVFVAAQVEKMLDPEFIASHGKPDVVITDPPRAGMHERVIEVLLQAAPQRIVYVSCNPATQARDLQLLSAGYEILEVQPVDMFPQTAHIENVVLLRSKADA